MTRPRCSVFVATSADGYLAGPDGEIDWLEPVNAMADAESYGFHAFYATVDALVMGRRTYEAALSFPKWPYPDKRVYVMTNRPVAPRHGERMVFGAPDAVLASLEAKHVYLDGGVVIRQFLAANLVDDLTISIAPVVLGGGVRLFEGGERKHALELVGTQTWPSGLVQLRWRLPGVRT
ncbi:MAG: dihydrofolate reductase [Deltaproteobacteria bacterium]|nr:dihydrofolate reductase [Deltaproteobacteria bacterium]MCW5802596.1 dihydrofolate reductase [Deltaproteobacteria bacterium]